MNQLDKCKQLKALLLSDTLEFAMEAHSGISAVIAEESGFKCLWASGLSVSAMTGCRDRNELDLSEVCKVVEWMADHTSVPILVDGDTGGVDFNAARIMVNKLTKAGAAGVCIEDKLYPKHNSFLDNSSNDLADPYIHAGKIRAMKAENSDFVVVARLEEFISGAGLDEAYRRAVIYEDAGADAILVHSKIKDDSEIKSFMEKWNEHKGIPIVIVPTKYYTTPTQNFRDYGISMVIWANHQMRASITAMQNTCKSIRYNESLEQVEPQIATVSEIFRLQRDPELQEEEKKYMTSSGGFAAILSAGKNSIGEPKAMDVISMKHILDHQKERYLERGISKFVISLPKDYEIDSTVIKPEDIIVRSDPALTSEVDSMIKTLESNGTVQLPAYISYGDLVFKDQVLVKTDNVTSADVVLVVDPEYHNNRYNELVKGSPKYSRLNFCSSFDISSDKEVCGSFVGIVKICSAFGLVSFMNCLSKVRGEDPKARFIKVIEKLMETPSLKLKGVYVTSDEWVDIKDIDDKLRARQIQ